MQVGFYFDQTRCTGCNACQVTCKDVNDIPAGPENRLRLGYTERGKPACVEACPTRALDAGPLDELQARYGKGSRAIGFKHSPRTQPAVVFKPKDKDEVKKS